MILMHGFKPVRFNLYQTISYHVNFLVKNSQAQLQHQLVRIENLRLMEEYGSEAWLKFNDILNKLVTDAQK